jgi:hypothetical protein
MQSSEPDQNSLAMRTSGFLVILLALFAALVGHVSATDILYSAKVEAALTEAEINAVKTAINSDGRLSTVDN